MVWQPDGAPDGPTDMADVTRRASPRRITRNHLNYKNDSFPETEQRRRDIQETFPREVFLTEQSHPKVEFLADHEFRMAA